VRRSTGTAGRRFRRPDQDDCNPHAERFVRTIKYECPNNFVFFGERRLRHVVKEFVDHYQTERFHQVSEGSSSRASPFRPTTTGPQTRSSVAPASAPCSTTTIGRPHEPASAASSFRDTTGFKTLRTRWAEHITSTFSRPVLIVDQAQETLTTVLKELRVLASKELDSRQLLWVVLAGDARLVERLRTAELIPLGRRIRRRLVLEYASRDELLACLDHLLETAAVRATGGKIEAERREAKRGAPMSYCVYLMENG